MESGSQRLARREWWLWFYTLVVTTLSGTVLLLSVFPSLFAGSDHFYEIRSSQARWAAFDLLLLFNAWLLYRQWIFRRERRKLTEGKAESPVNPGDSEAHDSFRIDPATGLYTRASFEHLLGKEVARSRRRKSPLSLVAIHIDDFAQFVQRFGSAASDVVIREFAVRLRKASRGADFGVRLGSDTFLLALPECSLNEAKLVLDRLGALEMDISGEDVTLTYSVGWIDYKPGEVPSDLIRRAEQVLQLYKTASKASTDSSVSRR
jgi:diguanylate cyclase (GGDEF)-like protein